MDLREVVQQAAAWVRRVRTDGAEWRVLPLPSVPELWPNMKAEDSGWRDAKSRIAKELADLTLLPRVGMNERARAHAVGITRWDDPRLDAAVFGVSAKESAILNAVLEVNRDGGRAAPSARLREGDWRRHAPIETYVDFEFLQDLADDFSSFPRKGGQALIFQIGCGTYREGAWRFRQFTVDDLSLEAEARMIDDWLTFLRRLCSDAATDIRESRLVHWSPASRATSSARTTTRGAPIPIVPGPSCPGTTSSTTSSRRSPWWCAAHSRFAQGHRPFDARERPHRDRLGEGLADGAGAMAGAWNAAVEAKRRGIVLGDTRSCARSPPTTRSTAA